MKRLAPLLLLVVLLNVAKAQSVRENLFYVTPELNLGNYIGIGVDLNYLIKEEYSVKAGYTINRRKPVTQPKDFTHGDIPSLSLLSSNDPRQYFDNFQVEFGKIYYLDKKRRIRTNFAVGIGYTRMSEPINWLRNGNLVTSSFSWDVKKTNGFSIILNPKIEFPLSRYYGFTFSLMLIANKEMAYFGIGVGQMIGKLKSKIKS